MSDLSNVFPFGGISTDSPEGRASSPVFQEKAVLGGGGSWVFQARTLFTQSRRWEQLSPFTHGQLRPICEITPRLELLVSHLYPQIVLNLSPESKMSLKIVLPLRNLSMNKNNWRCYTALLPPPLCTPSLS